MSNYFLNLRNFIQKQYGLKIAKIEELAWGADVQSRLFRIDTDNKSSFFLKSSTRSLEESALWLIDIFSKNNVEHIIKPIPSLSCQSWSSYENHNLVLFPYIDGVNGYEKALTKTQWIEFGKTIKQIQSIPIKPEFNNHIAIENYADIWREMVITYLNQFQSQIFERLVCKELAKFLLEHESVIRIIVNRAEILAQKLKNKAQVYVINHADLHAGNILITSDQFFIVDWDAPVLALKERDLMFIGAGLGFLTMIPKDEEKYFYQGYGQTKLDIEGIAYYRYERIIQDIAAFSQQILDENGNENELSQALIYLRSNFAPDGTIARADDAYNQIPVIS